MCGSTTQLGKGHPLRVPRCIPSGEMNRSTDPFAYSRMTGPFPVHRRRIAACTTRKGEFLLPSQSHDRGDFALPRAPSTKGLFAPLWTPTTNPTRIGCRSGLSRPDTHEQGLEMSLSTCTEPWIASQGQLMEEGGRRTKLSDAPQISDLN